MTPLLVTNETNLEKIQQEFSRAKSEILICSAWITSGMLKRVINTRIQEKIRQGKLSLRLIIRLGDPTDVKITDKGVFDLIEELGKNAQLRYHKKLHAKMFVADDTWAMIGSFNLTGGGFGDTDSPGTNPEAGFEFRDPAAISEVRRRFEEIWNAEDTKQIDGNLLGFVLSPSSSLEFFMLGIRDLPMNMFVQVKFAEEEYITGIIAGSEKHDLNYIESDFTNTDLRKRYELMDSFGKSDLGGIAKALTTLPHESRQLKVARVKVTNRITLKDGKLVEGGLTFSTVPPDVASEVYKAEKKILEQVFNREDFAPAVLHANPDIEVGFDPVELTTKHFSVFGSTGSGKSYFVKRLLSNELYQWFCLKQKGRIIIFDLHNEYREGKDMPAEFVKDPGRFETIDARQYKARLINDIDDLEEAVNLKFSRGEEKNNVANVLNQAVRGKWKNKQFIQALRKEALQVAAGPKVDLQKELTGLVGEVDKAFYQYLSELRDAASKIVDQELDEGTITIDDLKTKYGIKDKTDARSMYVHEKLKELYNTLSPKVRSTLRQQVIHKNIHKKIENYFESDIRVISEEIIETVEDAIKSNEITIEQLDLVKKMNKSKEYHINLAGINEEDIRHKLTASILTQIFNEKKENPKVLDTVFVIEEAHNFAPEGGGRNNPASRIIQKIAAEGRKFRLGLIVITQRPAYVSKVVLSQCSTQAIFRLININDLNQIREVVEGVGEAEINQLPHFETGQAIFAGVAIRQSVIVKGKAI